MMEVNSKRYVQQQTRLVLTMPVLVACGFIHYSVYGRLFVSDSTSWLLTAFWCGSVEGKLAAEDDFENVGTCSVESWNPWDKW